MIRLVKLVKEKFSLYLYFDIIMLFFFYERWGVGGSVLVPGKDNAMGGWASVSENNGTVTYCLFKTKDFYDSVGEPPSNKRSHGFDGKTSVHHFLSSLRHTDRFLVVILSLMLLDISVTPFCQRFISNFFRFSAPLLVCSLWYTYGFLKIFLLKSSLPLHLIPNETPQLIGLTHE